MLDSSCSRMISNLCDRTRSIPARSHSRGCRPRADAPAPRRQLKSKPAKKATSKKPKKSFGERAADSKVLGRDSKLFGNYKLGTKGKPSKPGGSLNNDRRSTKIGWSTGYGKNKKYEVFRISSRHIKQNRNPQGYGHWTLFRGYAR